MADRVEFNCPHCNQLYRLTADQLRRYAGRTAHCRKCQQPFTFPDASVVEAIAQEGMEQEAVPVAQEPARDASASMFGGTAVAGTAVASAASTLRETVTRQVPASRLEAGPVMVSVGPKHVEPQEREGAEAEEAQNQPADGQVAAAAQGEIPVARSASALTVPYHRPRQLGAPMSFAGFLGFRDLALPVLVQVVFWGGLIWCLYTGYSDVRLYFSLPAEFRESSKSVLLSGLSMIILGPVVLRLVCEVAWLLLRISRSLDEIRDASERGGG